MLGIYLEINLVVLKWNILQVSSRKSSEKNIVTK